MLVGKGDVRYLAAHEARQTTAHGETFVCVDRAPVPEVEVLPASLGYRHAEVHLTKIQLGGKCTFWKFGFEVL